jgi:hypothetical protein
MIEASDFNELTVGKLFVSGPDNTVIAPDGALGIMVKKEHNAFIGIGSIFVVWDNDRYAEYMPRDFGGEIKVLTGKRTEALNNADFSTDHKIIEAIKSSVFKKLFIRLKQQLKEI